MTRFAQIVRLSLCAAAGLAATAAHAATLGGDAYLGGALGPSDVDADCRYATTCDTGDTGFKIYAGFELPRFPLPHSALEVSYIDFGQAKVNFTNYAQRTVEASAVTFDLAARAPLAPSFALVGRLGLAVVSAKSNGPLVHSSDSGIEPHFGVGLEVAVNRQVKITGSFDYSNYDSGYESGSVHLLGIGAQFSF